MDIRKQFLKSCEKKNKTEKLTISREKNKQTKRQQQTLKGVTNLSVPFFILIIVSLLGVER